MNGFCCEVFPKIAKTFEWLSYERDKETMLCMPYIQGIEKFRINHCPSCGKKIRSIEIKLSDFKKL